MLHKQDAHPNSWCMLVTCNSAGCAGQMKDIVTTALGMFMFGDVQFELKNILGVGLGLAGGITYSYIVYTDRQKYQKLQGSRLPK